jgi:pyridoxamine 5'-phosphate oxidase
MDVGDVDPDPIVQFRSWLDDVVAAALPEPMAMVLCTASAAAGAQSLGRHVLLRGVDDDRGFAFVTNRNSRKGRHLAENPRACLVFPWFPIRRQVVVTGTVAEADDADSDAYWATRPRGSQIAGSVSEQSEPIPDKAWLERRFAEVAARYEGQPIPRPAHWGMHWLAPDSIELWAQGENRMHDRLLYDRDPTAGGWRITRLSP